ncbi:MAG: DUF975 family protein, partial [Ruminococcus sp.]
VAILFVAVIGVEYVSSVDVIKTAIGVADDESVGGSITSLSLNSRELLDSLMSDQNYESQKYGKLEIGRSQGVLAHLANMFSSGSITVTVIAAAFSIAKANDVLAIILIVLGLAAVFFIWMVFFNTFRAIFRRIFLECRVYERVPFQRFIFLYKVKRMLKSATTLLLLDIYTILWMFTIVGGVIKSFSYILVPYIVAENPDISPNEAITLSRKMMKGHKWERFLLQLSFIGWDILGVLTLGILNVFYVNPYKESVYCEYYARLRDEAKSKGIENASLLNDKYLYKKAPKKKIDEAYSDIIDLMNQPETEIKKRNKVLQFIADFFGVVLCYDESEKLYSQQLERKVKIKDYRYTLDGSMYPSRLCPVSGKEGKKRVEQLHYLRHYSVTSIILMFFIFSFIGWTWEVCFHLVTDGEFVNRGVLHGPWLPIYGSGGLMILVVLNKLRKYPVAEFFAAFTLCGIVEYFTAVFLEMRYGEKWWDYTGYFLNIDGKVCAEGLLIFGLGGMAIVYFVAPLLDNMIRKLSLKVLIPLCVVLSFGFIADQVYSSYYPNKGDGVTNYAEVSTQDNSEKLALNYKEEMYKT